MSLITVLKVLSYNCSMHAVPRPPSKYRCSTGFRSWELYNKSGHRSQLVPSATNNLDPEVDTCYNPKGPAPSFHVCELLLQIVNQRCSVGDWVQVSQTAVTLLSKKYNDFNCDCSHQVLLVVASGRFTLVLLAGF